MIQTPDGNRRELAMDELGAPPLTEGPILRAEPGSEEPIPPCEPSADGADGHEQPFGAGVPS